VGNGSQLNASSQRSKVIRASDEVLLGLIALVHLDGHWPTTGGSPDSHLTEKLPLLLDQLPTSFPRLIQALDAAMSEHHSRDWGWDDWILRDLDELTAHFIDFGPHLDRAFVLAALRSDLSLHGDTDWLPTLDLSLHIEKSAFAPIIKEFAESLDTWKPLVPSLDESRLAKLDDLLSTIARRRHNADLALERGLSLEVGKLSDFVDEVTAAYHAHASAVRAFEYFACIQFEVGVASATVPRLAANLLLGRSAFSSTDLGVVHMDLGDSIGTSLAVGIDDHVFRELTSAVSEADEVDYSEAWATLRSRAEQLLDNNAKQVAIISSDAIGVGAYAWHQKTFEAAPERRRGPGPIGWLLLSGDRKAPVFLVHSTGSQRTTVVVDMASVGTLKITRWSSVQPVGHDQVRGEIYFRIREFTSDEELRSAFLKAAWLSELSDEAGSDYLDRHVFVEGGIQFSYKCPDESRLFLVRSSGPGKG
jgi:hypothetical protein